MADKIYKKLPGILQTNTVKNFFESTVEQLYSKANLEPISGFIGKKTSKDKLVDGVWIYEEDLNKQFYSLTPAVNTTNATTNISEDFMFYDELVSTLKNYNVEMSNENKIFSTHYQSFLPPIEYNKFINYQEYFWTPHGSIKTLTAYISADSSRTAGSYTINSSKYTTSGNGFNAELSVVISSNGSGSVSLNKEGLYFNINDTITITDSQLGGGGGADVTLTITDIIKSPTAISVSGSASNPIDVDKDIVGKLTYTPAGGTTFRNGMKIAFAGSYVIDNSKYSGNEYIVEGVGEEIVLVPVIQNYSNGYNNPQTSKDYVLLGRGSVNNNVWSRVNFWYHKENFTDAGDDIPAKVHQADRPILEFDKDLELYNHGVTSKGNVDVSSVLLYSEVNGLDASNVTIDSVTIQTGTKIIFPNESPDTSKNIYVATVANASLSNIISLSVDSTFNENNTVFVSSGNEEIGKEYYYNDGLVQAQVKSKLNQAPLFNLYDDMHRDLGDTLIFPSSTFTGNKIFGLEVGTGTNDPIYGIPLVYRAFKSASEISFINFIDSTTYSRITMGSAEYTDISGNYKYKLCKTKPKYFNTFKDVTAKSTQRIETIHEITRTILDGFTTKFDIGCIPDKLNRSTVDNDDSLDITVKKNGVSFINYSYIDNSITIERKYLAVGDIFEVSALSSSGLIISTNNKSKHALPLAWSNNPLNESITKISEPEYLPHFKKYMEDQIGFTGDSLNVNNFSDLEKKSDRATDIVQTNEDLILGAFLLDDKPHNLIEALRFNANEYGRYKKRFLKELENYFNVVDFSEVDNDEILEKVLRNLISFSVGRNVFGDTYIMPFGDNYAKETKIIDDITLSSHTLTSTADLDKIENSLLVYYTRKGVKTLMTISDEYTLTYSPLTVTFKNYTPELLDELEFKIYNKDRDSVECPPTPSTMGLYPLYLPCKESDASFTEAQDVIRGHDGSRLPVFNDLRDDIVLEFEKRIYNSAKAEFRTSNSLPELNIIETRPGAFRLNALDEPEKLSVSEFNDLLQTNFENWVIENKVDPIINEFYNATDEFTWNYRGTQDTPGHWRGWYEYYYDTVRPHTHPWEMLGFYDKPTWWDSQYITTAYSDYGSKNTPMWSDLEKGIIRQGNRENITNDNYLGNYLSSGQNSGDINLYRRKLEGRRTGLLDLLPVDSDANLKSPYDIGNTGTTTKRITYSESVVNTSQGYKTTSFLEKDGINISYNSSKIYIRSISKPNYSRTLVRELPSYTINYLTQTYSLSNTIDLTTVAEGNGTDNDFSDGAIGILVNGLPLMSVLSSNTWGTTGWVYNKEYEDSKIRNSDDIAITNTKGVATTTVITSQMSNSSVWGDSSTHSGIVGWAFDGLPIYGPYGYTDPMNSSSAITNIKSGFVLNTDIRPNGPGGAPTGVFVQDYRYDTGTDTALGYASKYNHRVGYTPDSPSSPIRYYVVTIDNTGTPMFPYAIGGVAGSTSELPDSGMTLNTYVGKTYATLNDIAQNKIGEVVLAQGTTEAQTSTPNIRQSNTTDIQNSWRLGDGAPVENAWKYSEKYPFAVVEALLLHRPGTFATVFSDPTKLLELSYNLYEGGFNRNYLSKLTRKSWNFSSSTDFEIHGDIDDNGNTVTNIGYTQFINSWLRFQGLDIKTFFADKVRTLNTKLGYRFSGYVDKDTMTMSMDQYSTTGNSTNLIIPQENITLSIHNSPYKSRNIYQGVIIQKASTGYKVKGYDKNLGHFKILESDITGRSEKIRAGGEPHPYVDWQASTSYNKGTIVNYEDVYYEAKEYVPGGNTFSGLLFNKLNRLPQINFKEGAVYLDTTGTIKKVDYETVYTSEQEVFDFLVSLGRYQKDLGYTFGEYDIDINDTRDWIYSAKQFLFWLQDNWQVGNTLELSPMANKITFETTKGFVAKIKRSEYNMFNIMDKDGKSINPKECSINRQDLKLEIIPPTGKEIYGVCLFVREIEHAMVLDNVTDFADTLFNPLFNQQQSRIRLKGNRTANWDGRFISEGFLIQNDSLKPNLDNLAESMGRYHELGFIPVEKQVYETARSLFGYQEKKYLSELEIDDDQQFEFYKGFIQNKGTKTSLSRIGRSSAIIQGDMDIYDEWALKVGSFGDLENDQSVELALVKSDFVQDPQLFTLAFPEDTTGVIDRIDVLETDHKYFEVPVINITGDGENATATATLNTNGLISSIAVNNQGTGYTDTVGLTVTTAEINVGTITSQIADIEAKSTSAITDYNVILNDKTYQTARVVSVSQNDANGIVTVTGNLEGISNTHSVSFVGGDQGNLTSVYAISNVTSTTFTIDVDNTIVQASAGNINYIAHSTSTSANTIVISNAHGLSNNDNVYISNTNPITNEIESIFFNISNVTTNTFEIISNRLLSNVSGTYGKKNNNITNLTGLTDLIITDNFGASATIDISSVKDVANVVTAINNQSTINANITAHLIQNDVTSANTFTQYRSLKITGNDFNLADSDSNVTLGKLKLQAKRYQPRQRYAFDMAVANTPVVSGLFKTGNNYKIVSAGTTNFTLIGSSNNNVGTFFVATGPGTGSGTAKNYGKVVVKVDNTDVTASNYDFDPGDRWQESLGSVGTGNVTYTLGTGIIEGATSFASDNITEYNGEYPYIDVYVNGTQLYNSGIEVDNFYTVNNATSITINAALLEGGTIPAEANVYIVERPTIDLTDAYQGDLPGSALSIKATTDDDIAVHVKSIRLYEITPDAKDDEVILIDIDDTTRFLKKPSGVRESNIWPNTANVNFQGLQDSKYNPLPNSGYVKEGTVNFSAFDVGSIPDLFGDNIRFKPTGNDFIHVAKSENLDWNVYKLKQANQGNVNFVEQDDATQTAHLYTERSLFNYVDSNQLLEDDLSRYLDYTLVIKKADLSDEFVVWANEDIVRRKTVQISNFGRANMVTANIGNIGPTKVISISNINPAISSYTNADANIIGSNTVQISGSQGNLANGDTVEFFVASVTDRIFTTSNVEYATFTDTASLNNTSLANRTLAFTANTDYEFANVTVGGSSVNLESLEMAVYNSNPDAGNVYINESNIVIPATELTSSSTSVVLTRIHTSRLKLGVANINTYGSGIVAIDNVIRLTASNSLYNNASFTVSEVDTANNTITINIDIFNTDVTTEFESQYLTNTDLGITGFVFEEQYPLHAQRHTVNNVSLTGFTVEQANVSANIDTGNLSYGIFGKTEITATDHDLTSGELIKLDANAYSGFYYVESASTNTFKIDAPYNASISASGNIIPEGITINTTEDHGINVAYIGKRIAVHLATPRYYNQVYRVGDITSNTIIIDNSFGFYPYASEQFRDWSAGLTISKDERIRYNSVFYNAKQDFTSNASFSVDLEAKRFGPGMPTTITTLDHGAITLNNSIININNINSPESIKEEFNRQIDLRRGIIDDEGLTIPMLNNIECSERVYAGIPSSEIQGASPYAPRSPNMEGLLQKGVMNFGTVDDLKYGFPGESIDDVYGGDQKLFNHNFAGHSITNPTTRSRSAIGQVQDNTSIPLYDIVSSGKTLRRTDYVGSPILDPVKAFASLDVKLCEICAPAPPPVSSSVTNRNGKKYINKKYGGTITVSASGNGKGKRNWGGSYSGFYRTTGTGRGQNSQAGGSKHMPTDALLGAITWADNGSRNTFSLQCTFSEAGTFYVHAYYSAKSSGGSSSISISGVHTETVSPKYLGLADSNYSGTGAVSGAITVAAGETITISGVAQWGSNHWNSVGFHLSTRDGSLSTTATIEEPGTGTPVTPPDDSSTNSNTQLEFIEQSTTGWAQGNAGNNDEWLFNPGASGTIELLFDMFGGADGIEIFQGDQVTQGILVSSSQTQNLSVLSDLEKSEILANAQKAKARGGRNQGTAGVIRNFVVSAVSAPNNTGVKYGGAIRFNYNKANGDFIKVRVYKSSSVYRFLMKYPKVGPDIPNPGQNPTTTGPCDTASDGNTTVSGNSLPQTPINTPVGGGGTTGGGTTGGGTTGGGTTGGGTTGGGTTGGGGSVKRQAMIQAYGPVLPYVAPIPKMPIYKMPQITPFISPSILSIAPVMKFGMGTSMNIGKGIKSMLSSERLDPSNFFQSNFGDVGLPSLAGHRFIPNILRKTVKVTKPSNIGRFIPLESGQYVNTTMQKVTGGKKVPLATPLIDAVPLRPSPLRAIDVKEYNYNFISQLSNPFFSKTDNQIMFSAQKIGGDLILPDGSSIRNVLGDAGGISSDVIEFRYPGNELVDFTNRNITDTHEYLPRDTELPGETTPPDTDNIEFNRNGGFEIQPLLRSPEGNYIVGGPPVNCHFHRPTPGISIPHSSMTGIKPGDELLINNRKYVFPGSDPKVVINTLRCGPKGSGIEVKDTKVNGEDAIRISSCSNAPIVIRDGCAGGVYKEVLDFHVVRGFEQSVVDTSNTLVLPAIFGTANTVTSASYNTYGPQGENTGVATSGGVDITSEQGVGAILSSSSSGRSTGGSGYIVGDRLRLVGGTPIADPYGSITEICLNSPGSGYSDTANIVVYIGDGNTPGSGAKAGSVILDDTGGIKNILMVNGGEGYDITKPPTVRIIDLNNNGGGAVLPASAHAKISSGQSVPPRVAKFVVTSIDAVGTITSLQIIDRGIYKMFPSDLTMGIPLEYDYVNLGDETGTDADGNFYQGTGLGQFDPLNDAKRLGTPGGYDPINDTLGGGSGARVFLTAREIPDCSEKGNARSQLGLPERITEINIPEDIAACFNNNLGGTGYDKDLYLETEPVNDCITALKIKHPGFDGLRLNENVPGFLDRLGLPKGDYNQDMLCMTSTIITKSFEQDRDKTGVVGTDIIDIDGYGTSGFATTETTTLEIYCIDNLITDPNSLFGVAGNTGGADSANAVGLNYTTDLYQYQLETLQGQPVNTTKLQQNCDVYYLESHRFANTSVIDSHVHIDDGNVTLADYDKAWIDNYNTAIGWAYVESNDIKYSNSPLVDSKFVNNTIIYDAETGEKDWDLYEYDPFKGIIPGFIEKEIEFIGQSDPVVYSQARTRFGSKDIGKVWWDTSTIRYKWYEQGTNRERWLNWGKTFPGSSITLFEWVESNTLPQTYIGSGTPKNLVEYITEVSKDDVTGLNNIKYYFWVQNKTELEPTVVEDLGRTHNTFELARLLADPIGQGLPLISFISDTSFVLSNASSIIKEDEQNLQINLSKNLNPIGQKHNAWKLLREGDNNSIIPLDLGNKLIDSLCGVDASGKTVPDPLLSEVEKYGVAFRPRQTMFGNIKDARRELAYTLNGLLADVKLTSNFTNWDIDLPTTRTYIETVNWFETIRTDASNNKKIRYDSTYKPILNVGSVSELTAVTSSIKDGAIIQVKPNVTSRYELWKYVASTNTFTQIAIENETVKLKDTIFTDESNPLMRTELRALLVALRDNVFTSNLEWNKLFFALLKYSAVEQDQLSWAFKTSFIYIEKEEEDLVAVDGFKVDNFDKVLQYLDEAKPYTSKIREYKDGKSPAKELIQYTQISDFDKPPYPDSASGNIRILDDFLQSDSNIIQTNNNYVKYFGFSSNADVNTPIRKLKSTIIFDRTHTVLTDFVPLSNINADYTLVDNNTSIATNIVTLMGFGNTHNSNTTISNTQHYRYADRVFKFDTEVQAQLKVDLDKHFNVSNSTSNANIIGSSANILLAINAGNLNSTLALVTDKVGGNFRGTTIDAKLFDTQTGYGSEPIGTLAYDKKINIDNYEGTFTGTSTLTKDNIAYDGFDGVTFQRVGYGDLVPEEMALFDPYETLILNVLTSKNLAGNSSLATTSANASTVEYQITMDLFGKTEYMRKLQDGSTNTTLTANLLIADSTISVANANVCSNPTALIKGVLWVESERIEYTARDLDTNTISGLIRGTNGTTIQDWYSSNNVIVWNGNSEQIFDEFVDNSVESNIWLSTGSTSLTDKGNIDTASTSVMKFLHNLK
tara:strand:- start:10550 stop:28219 length:17670 start_codon:yes stop_codon:yes gene_type:complete